jgi:aspartyl-tRNA(Asn)/glutamyl-tRNA(Gln) amidotransferase subunit A
MVAYSSSLDQAGVLAKSVDDACLVMDRIVGKCDKDSTTVDAKWDTLSETVANVKGKVIAYIPEDMNLVSQEVRDTWLMTIEVLREHGAKLVELKYTDIDPTVKGEKLTDRWLATYYILTPVEAFSNLSRYDGIRYGSKGSGGSLEEYYQSARDKFGKEVKRRLLLGSYILLNEAEKKYYHSALSYLNTIRKQFHDIYRNVDLLLTPTSPGVAFKRGEELCPERMYAGDMFTIIANLLMAPAISIPAPTGGLPIGIQLMARRFDEANLIEVAKFLEIEFKRLKK